MEKFLISYYYLYNKFLSLFEGRGDARFRLKAPQLPSWTVKYVKQLALHFLSALIPDHTPHPAFPIHDLNNKFQFLKIFTCYWKSSLAIFVGILCEWYFFFCAFACPSAGYPWGTWLSLYYVLCILWVLNTSPRFRSQQGRGWCGGSCALCLLSVHININNLYNATLCWIRWLYLFCSCCCSFFAFSFNTLYKKVRVGETEMGSKKWEPGSGIAWAANCWHLVVVFSYFRIFLNFVTFYFLLMPLVGTAAPEMISLFCRFFFVLYFVNYFSLFSGCCGTCPSDLTNRQASGTSDRLWLSDYNENESFD